ncbi:MAG: DNA repair protein RecN [Deltaproteobacteria bacterium]|nr:DNA repair protein RecN [Deltaproteobacteria bacterium]
MLDRLTISNFAIISHLEINFRPGLNILSGETGAGKSIIINAVNLILGGRATADLIRSGSNEARVEALFRLPENPSITELLSDLGFPFNGELLIKRTISRGGRNRISVNGSMSTLQMLSRVGLMLISISGQHEHQLLLKPDNHLYLLDEFGGLTDRRLKLNESFSKYQSLKGGLSQLEREIKEGEERQELTRFQLEEIEGADIREEEDRLLEDEKRRLRYAEQLMGIVTESYQTLYEKEGSVLSEISLCTKKMEKWAEVDQRLKNIGDAFASTSVELEEAALELRDLQKTIVIDPIRLEEVEERLQFINRLKRKYGPSIKDIMDFRHKLSEVIDNMGQKREELERISKRLKEMETGIVSRAADLSRRRRVVAKKLEKAVKNELNLLDMSGTRFEVSFHKGISRDKENEPENMMKAIKEDGYDSVELMLSPNIGEELKPLARVASGGELSRIMLAVKTILARTTSVETIIFDEVDSGIGGATAEVVGEKLQALAGYHQILCITHLPQIASKSAAHFLVTKRVMDGRTQTIISELDPEKRVKEIARLLGGKVISQQAIAHAREMLG